MALIFSHEVCVENGCRFQFFFFLSLSGLWDIVLADQKVHWTDGKWEILNPQFKITTNCSHCLVGLKMAETCWFNLTFLTPSPGVGCFVYSNHMLTIWCYIYVLAFCCLWSSCHGQFSQFLPDMNNASVHIHHYLFESAMLIQTGSHVFKEWVTVLLFLFMWSLYTPPGMFIVYKRSHFLV